MLARLISSLDQHERIAIAVSGGVDSMTLAAIAQRFAKAEITVAHAISPAVPKTATERVKAYAEREGWALTILDAGEMADPVYRSNPADRCYYCKSCLYDRIAGAIPGIIASGTNTDDLGDYRPGLKAAAERQVIHPFVEAGIDKAGIRALARQQGLGDLADLPAQPCLASRIETGIVINAEDLAFIETVEQGLKIHVEDDLFLHGSKPTSPEPAPFRCRITHQGVSIEVSGLSEAALQAIAEAATGLCAAAGRTFLGIRPYRRGSAFLVKA